MYNKKMLSEIKLGKEKKSHPYKNDMIVDPMGQWKHPGENTRIPGNNITMKGVNYPVLGVGSDGQKQMMYPGQDYQFPGASYVDEYPQMRRGGVLPKAQTGNNYGCDPGMQWDPVTRTCVPIPRATIVEDFDDPRYQRYLELDNLYRYSLLDNFNQRNDLMPSDVLLGDFSAWDRNRQEFKSYEPNEEYPFFWDDDDSTGAFGSQTVENYVSKSELNDFINAPEFPYLVGMGAWELDEGKDILKKYPPASYHTYDQYGSSPFTHTFARNKGTRYGSNRYWTQSNTAFIEDNVNREILKQAYPLMTDADIDKHIAEVRRAPSYITNHYDPYYNYYTFGQRFINQIPKTEDGLFDKTYQITRAEANDPDNYYAKGMGPRKAYLQESETDDVYKSGQYLPVWGPPQERFDYIPKLEIKPLEPVEDEIIRVDYTAPKIPRKIRIDNKGEEWELIEEPTYREEMEYGQYADGTWYPKGRKKVQSGTQQRWVKKYTEEEPSFLNTETGTFSGYKKGGGVKTKKYSRSLEATNKLFSENSLLKKLKSRKKKIYDPKAKYYQKGGAQWSDPTYNYNSEEPTSYDPVTQTVHINQGDFEGMSDQHVAWALQDRLNHENYHHWQNLNGELRDEDGIPLEKPAYVSNQNYDGYHYYNRGSNDIASLIEKFRAEHPDARFMTDDMIYNKVAGAQQYEDPHMMEGEARAAEYAYNYGAPMPWQKKPLVNPGLPNPWARKSTLQDGGTPYNYNPFVSNEPEVEETPNEFNPIRTENDPEDYQQFLDYSNTAPENRRPGENYTYGNPNDYDHYGMWDALGKPQDFNQALENNPWWQPDEYDHMYHGFSVNPNTGVFLKSGKPGMKPGDTTWMEVKDHYLSDRSNSSNLTFNPDLQRFQYTPNEEYIETELTPEEIEQYQQGGYIVEDISIPELNQAQKGGTRKSLAISDPVEYAYRKAAYDDSLWLYNQNKGWDKPIKRKYDTPTGKGYLGPIKHSDHQANKNQVSEVYSRYKQSESPYFKSYNKAHPRSSNSKYKDIPHNEPIHGTMRHYDYHRRAVVNPFNGKIYGVTLPGENYGTEFDLRADYKKPVQPVYLSSDKDKNKSKNKSKSKSKGKGNKSKGKDTWNHVKEKVVLEPEVNFDDIRLPLKPIDTTPLMGATEDPRSLNLGAPKFELSNKLPIDNYGQEYVSQKVPIYDWKVVHTEDPNMPGRYITKRIKYIAGYEEVGGMNTTKQTPTVYDFNKPAYKKGGIAMGQEVELTPAQEAHLRKLGYKLERIK